MVSAATPYEGTAVLLGRGDGTFADPVSFDVGGDSIVLADLDGDDRTDVALATGAWLRNGGGGAFEARTIGVPSGATSGVAVGDLDGDGLPDVAYSSGLVALQAARGGWLVPEIVSGGIAVALGEVDGDLEPDLLSMDFPTAGMRGLYLRRGLGDGTFGAPALVSGDLAEVPLGALGDLDGDGKTDLVTADGTTLASGTGTGAGAFTAGGTLTLESRVVALVLADLDGDGRADLATLDAPALVDSGGALRVRRGTATGFEPPILVAGAATAVAVADVDADGRLDLLDADRNALSVDVFFDAAAFAFDAPVTVPVQATVNAIAVGDVDGDGRRDLVVTTGLDSSWSTQYTGVVLGGAGASSRRRHAPRASRVAATRSSRTSTATGCPSSSPGASH